MPRRLKPFFSTKKSGGTEGLLYPGRPRRVLLSFSLPFSLNPEGDRGRTEKGIKFWTQRLIINLAGELSFRGTWFQNLPTFYMRARR